MPRLGRATRWLFIAMLMIGVLTTWALATARYGGPDEPAHVLRAAAVARGDLLGDTVDGLVGGFRAVNVPAALTTGDPKCFRHDRRIAATCAHADGTVTGDRRAASSAGTNPPWYYLAVGLPVRVFGGTSSVISYRLVALVLAGAVYAAAMVRRRGPALPALVAIAPATWFLGGVVNPNSLEIALAVLAWVGVARLTDGDDRVLGASPNPDEVAWIAWPAATAILIRPLAAVAIVAMVMVLALLRRRARLARRDWWRLLAPPVGAVVASLAWGRWSAVSVSDDRVASGDGVLTRIGTAVRAMPDTVRELSGSLGWAEFSAPWVTQLFWWTSVAVCAVYAVRRGGGHRAAWLALAASVVLVPVAFESVLAGRIGYIWQGRYSIPMAVGLVLIAPWRPRQAVGLAVAAVASEVGALWATLRRYTVGSNGSWLLRDQRWHPAMPPFVLLGLNAALMAALVLSVGGFGDLTAHDVEG